jgi:hypothetical protein
MLVIAVRTINEIVEARLRSPTRNIIEKTSIYASKSPASMISGGSGIRWAYAIKSPKTGMNAMICRIVRVCRKAANWTTKTSHSQSPKAAGL